MRVAYYVWFMCILAIIGCEVPSSSLSMAEPENAEDLHFLPPFPDSLPIAVCLWERVRMGLEPGIQLESDYVSSILLGDHVYVLGDQRRVAKEKRTYMKVRNAQGEEGWVPRYLFGLDAQAAVIVQAAQLYRRPNLLMKKGDRLYPGDFIVVVEETQEWVKVMGVMKKQVGWIQKDPGLSVQQQDIRMAVLYQRAKSEKEPARRVSMLESLLQNAPEGSNFVEIIEGDLEESAKQLNNDQELTGPEVQAMTLSE